MTIKIDSVNTKPGLDVYHRDTQGITRTQVALDPQKRTLWVVQEDDDNATPMNEYLRLVLTFDLGGHPEEADVRAYLGGKDAQALLEAVCEGFEVQWDGNNNVGTLTDPASDAWDELYNALNDLADSDWACWAAADWLKDSDLEGDGLQADMTDEELDAMADRLLAEAESDHVVILDRLSDYLERRRTELTEEE